MIKIHSIQCGLVRTRTAQLRRKRGGPLRILLDRKWSEWMPILAWVIEHPDGLIVVDTGETARVSAPGYLPSWHPFYRLAASFDVKPGDEIGPQLRNLGISPKDVSTVILTHLHTDHAGGLRYFLRSRIFVPAQDYRTARGPWGKLNGYLPHRWPEWFAPVPVSFYSVSFGPFPRSFPVTAKGDVVVVPTPGHTPGHISVIVRADVDYFIAGDATYSEAQLLERRSDGISLNPNVSIATIDRICDYMKGRPTVYLPTHDPGSSTRLRNMQVTKITAYPCPSPNGSRAEGLAKVDGSGNVRPVSS